MRTRSRPSATDARTNEADDGVATTPPAKSPKTPSSKKRKTPAAASATPTIAQDSVPEETTASRASKMTKGAGSRASAAAVTPSKKRVANAESLAAQAEPKQPKSGLKGDDASSGKANNREKKGWGKEGVDGQSTPEEMEADSSVGSDSVVSPGLVNAVPVVRKGRCVSGRDWKVRNQSQRASMQVTTATQTLSTTWAKKLEIKAKRQAIMAMEREMKDRKRQEIEEKKQEKLDREKRRQQNEMKNTTYQTITKTHKMKTMSKKQLRQIKKRQVNARTGEIEFVSPWGGGGVGKKK